MKERPILFSGPMVKAILEGRKTQTRRALKRQPQNISGPNHDGLWSETIDPVTRYFGCPYGAPGDRLWVKETHARVHPGMLQSLDPDPESHEWTTVYRADANGGYVGKLMECTKWKPSIFMRREFSRITLEIEAVRVERLQDISEEDSIAEGAVQWWQQSERLPVHGLAKNCYKLLWQSINGPGSWDANPFVWVLQFRGVL